MFDSKWKQRALDAEAALNDRPRIAGIVRSGAKIVIVIMRGDRLIQLPFYGTMDIDVDAINKDLFE